MAKVFSTDSCYGAPVIRVVCAPNAFKGTLSALDAAAAMATGVADAGGIAVAVPMADGGDGTMAVLVQASGGWISEHVVSGPLGEPVSARIGWLDATTAVVEMAEASGLRLLPNDQRRPLAATSLGTGELLAAALDAGATSVIVGVGGSASTDGGAGLLIALGVRPIAADGAAVGSRGGAELERIDRIGHTAKWGLGGRRVSVACDVQNPLLGPRGSAPVFAPQKGAGPDQVAVLERGLCQWAAVVVRDLAPERANLAERPMTGAAGGAAFGLSALGAELVDGAALVADAVGLTAALVGADLCLTGEGCFDATTKEGKAPAEVILRARAADVPCRILAGRIEGDVPAGISAIAIGAGLPLEEAMEDAAPLLRRATALAVRAHLNQ